MCGKLGPRTYARDRTWAMCMSRLVYASSPETRLLLTDAAGALLGTEGRPLAACSEGLCPPSPPPPPPVLDRPQMAETQSRMITRQLEMQLAMRERMLAVQVAQARDMLRWYGAFACLAFPALLLRAWKTKNPAFGMPIVPIRRDQQVSHAAV
jgi:hypothetical protein